jgi:prolipoprotein diacylglyceryl transferase
MPTLVLPFPAINPIIVQWGPLAIRWYALAYIGGLVLGWLLIRRIVSDDHYWNGKKRPSADTIDDLLVYCAFGVIIGGRLGNVLFYDPRYYFAHPIEIFKVWEGGMAFHGGLIGALIGILLFCRRYKAPVLTVLDLCSLVAPIGIFLGRIANFIRPELRGRMASRAIRARFTKRCSKASWLSSSFTPLRKWALCAVRVSLPACSRSSTARRAFSANSFASPIRGLKPLVGG